jgi:hypothetical protein
MSSVPKIVFIVPYRNRPQHKFFFSNYLKTIMSESNLKKDYEVYFSHQIDTRVFNRGATKNIGFLAIKEKYPNDYKNITFVFNDIDTIPFSSLFHYETVSGTVKHFYGFDYALGGIVAINGHDYETVNGFPNFWGWGMEDKVLQTRCLKKGLTIDRSQFFPIGNPNILHLFDGVQRIINQKDPWRAENDNGLNGLMTLYNLKYSIDAESMNPLDNIHVVDASNMFMINITTFMTGTNIEQDTFHTYDLREPQQNLVRLNVSGTTNVSGTGTNDNWSNIPFYPTKERRNEMVKKYGQKDADTIIKYSYANSTDPTKEVIPNELTRKKIQQYNESLRNINSSTRIIPRGINKYSKEYARIIAVKPRSTSSANIRLGGVY